MLTILCISNILCKGCIYIKIWLCTLPVFYNNISFYPIFGRQRCAKMHQVLFRNLLKQSSTQWTVLLCPTLTLDYVFGRYHNYQTLISWTSDLNSSFWFHIFRLSLTFVICFSMHGCRPTTLVCHHGLQIIYFKMIEADILPGTSLCQTKL